MQPPILSVSMLNRLARERLESVAEYNIPVTRALEDSEIKRTHVWRFRPA